MIAVDSSVLLDVLTDDPVFASASADAIGVALAAGDVVVCDAVVAEVQTMLDTRDTAMEPLATFGIRFLATSEQAAVRAGHMQRRFRDRGGRRSAWWRTLIGAHAAAGDALITRDASYRDYFKGLKVVPQHDVQLRPILHSDRDLDAASLPIPCCRARRARHSAAAAVGRPDGRADRAAESAAGR
jgi:hypothetical protein